MANLKAAESLCTTDDKLAIVKFREEAASRWLKYDNFKDENGGKRNFKKEAESRLIELGNLTTTRFKDKPITREYIKANIMKNIPPQYEFLYTQKNFLETCEKHLIRDVNDAYRANDYKTIIENSSRCIGNGTQYSVCYHDLAKMITQSRGGFKAMSDYKLILSLYLKGSLSPIELEGENHLTNYQVTYIYAELGRIYKNALLGEPFDPKKAKYYLKLAINNHDPSFEEKLYCTENGSAFALLGDLYCSAAKIQKAKQCWEKGSQFRDSVSFTNLCSFSNILGGFDIETNKVVQEQKNNKNLGKSSYYSMISRNYKEIDQQQSQYPLDFNEIKKLSNEPDQLFIQSIYNTHSKVIKFTNQYNSMKEHSNKLEIIKPLADAYRDQESFFAIRLQRVNLIEINEFVNQLKEEYPMNIDVAICWLGLNRFTIHPVTLIKYIEKLLKDGKVSKQDESTLLYFKCIFIRYDFDEERKFNRFEDQFKLSNQYIKNNPGNNPLKDTFIYLSLSIVWYLDNIQELFENSKGLYELLFENSKQFIERNPKSNEQVAEIYFSLAYIKSKLGHGKKSILQSYNKGIEYSKTIPKLLSFRSSWLESNHTILKQLLSTQFNDNSYLNNLVPQCPIYI